MQDTFTRHFIRPDVSDPVGRLFASNLHFWGYFPVLEPTSLLLILGLVVIGVRLCRRDAVFAALVIAIAATGIGTVAAHPVASQADRLMVAVWLLIVLGVPLLVSDFGRRFAPGSAAAAPKEPEVVERVERVEQPSQAGRAEEAGRAVISERPEQPEQPYVAQSR
jgi:hypothetical protein